MEIDDQFGYPVRASPLVRRCLRLLYDGDSGHTHRITGRPLPQTTVFLHPLAPDLRGKDRPRSRLLRMNDTIGMSLQQS